MLDAEIPLPDFVGRYLLHEPTLVVGRVKSLHEPGEYVSPANGAAVPDRVFEFENGHALLAFRESFVAMGRPEIRFFQAMQEGIAGIVAISGKNASQTVDPDTGFALTVAALRAQLAALEAS